MGRSTKGSRACSRGGSGRDLAGARARVCPWVSPWAAVFSRQAGTALRLPPAQFSLLLLKMSTSYLARIFPDLENSIKQLSNA